MEGKYFEKPCFLEPDKASARAYALLRGSDLDLRRVTAALSRVQE